MTEPKLLPLRSRLFSLLIFGSCIFIGLQSILVLAFLFVSKSSHVIFVLSAGVIAFILSVFLAIYFADQLAIQISRPLKETVEALTLRSQQGAFLRLPKPHSLETRILFHEIQKLWRQLRELQGVDTEELISRNDILEGVLESMGDAVFLLSTGGQILYCNQTFSSLIRLPRKKIIHQVWTDLASLEPNYLALRELLSTTDQTQVALIRYEGQKESRELFYLKKIQVHFLKSPHELYVFHRAGRTFESTKGA